MILIKKKKTAPCGAVNLLKVYYFTVCCVDKAHRRLQLELHRVQL